MCFRALLWGLTCSVLYSRCASSTGAASAAFGRLETRLWKERGVRLSTKVAVYKAVVTTTLLYGCESWITYRRHIRSLDQFHMRCLHRIARITWQDKTPNTEVLQRCEISGIEAFIIKAQLRWVGQVGRMSDSRIPKATFYAELLSAPGPTADHCCASKTT